VRRSPGPRPRSRLRRRRDRKQSWGSPRVEQGSGAACHLTPELVGGHCIGVDPYYLTGRAEAAGYYPQVILSGRRINDGMGGFIAQRLVKLLIAAERPVKGARIGILGITFKEDVPDLRNSRVPDIVAELREFGIAALVG
jgi:UDP-N-acetyl-D-galactosamine dehydrogenase